MNDYSIIESVSKSRQKHDWEVKKGYAHMMSGMALPLPKAFHKNLRLCLHSSRVTFDVVLIIVASRRPKMTKSKIRYDSVSFVINFLKSLIKHVLQALYIRCPRNAFFGNYRGYEIIWRNVESIVTDVDPFWS